MVKPQCVLALGTLAAASPPPSRNNCSPVTFKVSATAENLVFTNPPDPNNATQIITFFQQGLTLGIPTNGTKTVSSDFVINGVYCRPTANKGKHPRALQLLVHGVSYNSSYWSGLGFGEKYNWHSYANDQGYHTLAIDRPGHGKNSRNIDPLGVIQTPMEVDVLHKVISAIKAGARNGNDGLDKAFSDVIYVSLFSLYPFHSPCLEKEEVLTRETDWPLLRLHARHAARALTSPRRFQVHPNRIQHFHEPHGRRDGIQSTLARRTTLSLAICQRPPRLRGNDLGDVT